MKTLLHMSVHLSLESYDIEDGYIEMTDEFIKECQNTHDRSAIKSLLERHTIKPKLAPNAKFAASPIHIKDKDYDFSRSILHSYCRERTFLWD